MILLNWRAIIHEGGGGECWCFIYIYIYEAEVSEEMSLVGAGGAFAGGGVGAASGVGLIVDGVYGISTPSETCHKLNQKESRHLKMIPDTHASQRIEIHGVVQLDGHVP